MHFYVTNNIFLQALQEFSFFLFMVGKLQFQRSLFSILNEMIEMFTL